jgi:hypothetical protein
MPTLPNMQTVTLTSPHHYAANMTESDVAPGLVRNRTTQIDLVPMTIRHTTSTIAQAILSAAREGKVNSSDGGALHSL